MADDRVQGFGGNDRALRLLVDVGEQRADFVGGQKQAVALVIVAMDRHADTVHQASRGDHHLSVVLGETVVSDDAGDHTQQKSRRENHRAMLTTIWMWTQL